MRTLTALCKSVKTEILERFPDLGTPENECWDETRFASARLVECIDKKQIDTLDRSRCEAAALTTFLEVNQQVGAYNASERRLHEWEEELFGCFKQSVYNFFYPQGMPLICNWNSVVSRGDLGSGANLKSIGTDFYSKLFHGNLSCTSVELYDLYRRCIPSGSRWHEAEQARTSAGYSVDVVAGNKLGFVDKNDRTSRVIATEPVVNMLLQRGISNLLEDRLRSYGIDLSVQPELNRSLAQIGSKTGSFSTIDLSSASDSISLRLCEEVIPKQQLAFFKAVRCPVTYYKGRSVSLEMLSTMGNGYTFSLQTVLFTCMVEAAFVYAERRQYSTVGDRSEKNWGVFGDDIIVPADCRGSRVTTRVLDLLRICGFTTNKAKTFVEGPFRESCGGDYLFGVNVRPVHLKSLKTLQSRYVAINLLVDWCARWYELHSVRRLVQSLKREERRYVPYSMPDDSGIRAPYSLAVRRLRSNANGTLKIKCSIARPRQLAIGEEGDTFGENAGCMRMYNPDGLLVAFLRGDIRKGRLSVRAKVVTYSTRGRLAPNWCTPHATADEAASWERTAWSLF